MAETLAPLVGGEALPGIPLIIMGEVEGGVIGLHTVVITLQSKVLGTSESVLTGKIVHSTMTDPHLVKFLSLEGVGLIAQANVGLIGLGWAVVHT